MSPFQAKRLEVAPIFYGKSEHPCLTVGWQIWPRYFFSVTAFFSLEDEDDEEKKEEVEEKEKKARK